MTETATTSEMQRLVVTPAASRVGKFFEGVGVPWLGLKVLLIRPRLWVYAIVPLLLNLAIMAAAIFAMFVIGSALLASLWASLGGEWNQGWWLVAKMVILVLGGLSTVIICIAAAVILWRLLSTLFCGYFYSRIAIAVEMELGLPRDQMREMSMWDEMRDALTDMGWLLIALALALAVSLIPLIGPPVALAYSLYFQILTCGRDQFSYPLSLRGRRRAERVEFCRENLPHTMGVGTVVLMMEFIPIIGALFLVTAAAGAVILHRRLIEHETTEGTRRNAEPTEPATASTTRSAASSAG